jgi:large repetitive protein
VGDKNAAEIGDAVRYTIAVRNTTASPVKGVTVEDLLPAGFRYVPGTARLGTVTIADPVGATGRALTFSIGTVPANAVVSLNYFVRLGVGSQLGDGVNRATAVFTNVNGAVIRSNTSQYKVLVQGGVLGNEGCIIGKVYVDCDGTHNQNNESGSRELGIPGVRLVMLDGSYSITDNEGKYSICGVKAQTHVIKVDRTTLPKQSRLLPSSNRNAGVGDSLFVDLKGGELARADFIEGSCSPEVLDQVKARRAEGGILAPEKEQKLNQSIDSRPAEVQQQILPSVRPESSGDSGASVPGGARP